LDHADVVVAALLQRLAVDEGALGLAGVGLVGVDELVVAAEFDAGDFGGRAAADWDLDVLRGRLGIGRTMTSRFRASIPPHPDPLPPGEREVILWPILWPFL
jgi:hypothetical protein